MATTARRKRKIGTNVTGGVAVETPAVGTQVVEHQEQTPRLQELSSRGGTTLTDVFGSRLAELAVHTVTVSTTLYRQGGRFYLGEDRRYSDLFGFTACSLHGCSKARAEKWVRMNTLGMNLSRDLNDTITKLDRKDGVAK